MDEHFPGVLGAGRRIPGARSGVAGTRREGVVAGTAPIDSPDHACDEPADSIDAAVATTPSTLLTGKPAYEPRAPARPQSKTDGRGAG
jgi:hypothetical protein